MFQKIFSVSVQGLDATRVDVEVDISRGLNAFSIVGLWDTAIQESRERIRAGLKNAGFSFPTTRITVNLAPADSKKKWPSFDVPIAVGILAHEQVFKPEIIEHALFIGELALDGKIRSVPSVLPTAIFCQEKKISYLFVPEENAQEAALIPGVQVIPMKDIQTVAQMLTGKKELIIQEPTDIHSVTSQVQPAEDFCHIIGQEQAKRALMISAAGGHNILMEGPPGSGKTMLAKALAGILPDLDYQDLIEITKIYSIAGLLSKDEPFISKRPFRKIHHTASGVSIIGGGRESKPGEISLAHKGVLFLDEFLEFPLSVIETLRQPLEDGNITINRVHATYSYPADFMFVGAFNPTPSGLEVHDPKCPDTPQMIAKYRSKLSGPIVDRIDLFITVPRVPVEDIKEHKNPGKSSADLKKEVQKIRDIQRERFKNEAISTNCEMKNSHIKKYCILDETSEKFLQNATAQLDLSTRAYFRILKLARTIADVEWKEKIQMEHVAEAIGYRKSEES